MHCPGDCPVLIMGIYYISWNQLDFMLETVNPAKCRNATLSKTGFHRVNLEL
jgi:hypothetical protein